MLSFALMLIIGLSAIPTGQWVDAQYLRPARQAVVAELAPAEEGLAALHHTTPNPPRRVANLRRQQRIRHNRTVPIQESRIVMDAVTRNRQDREYWI